MKLKMLQGIAGADFSLSPGDVTERFDGKEAERLVAGGIAVPHVEARKETATKTAPETRKGRK